MVFEKILNMPQNKGAKVENYGLSDEGNQCLVILTNGHKYMVELGKDAMDAMDAMDAKNLRITKTDIPHSYEEVEYEVPGQKCLWNGVQAPYTTSYTKLVW